MLEGELARFFGFSHDVLAILEATARVFLVSPSLSDTLGYAPESIRGTRATRWIHPSDLPRLGRAMRILRTDSPVPDLDLRIRASNGAWVPMRWSLSPGTGGRVYGIGRDQRQEARYLEAALREEMAAIRARTSLELHDGVLQTLTAASLQIAVARRLLEADPAAADRSLEMLANTIEAEYREIRLYIDELKGETPTWTDESLALDHRIASMIHRVGLIWGVETDVSVDMTRPVAPETSRRVLRILQEATVNAARHGGARTVRVALRDEGSVVVLRIADDGHGFPFKGHFDDTTLHRERLGPVSLKHRVLEADGRISIDSADDGSVVEVRIPRVREDDE